LEKDRLLKGVAIKFASQKYKELTAGGDFIKVCEEKGEIGVDIIKAVSVIPEVMLSRGCPSCKTDDWVL
jgi:hypothetical protein